MNRNTQKKIDIHLHFKMDVLYDNYKVTVLN